MNSKSTYYNTTQEAGAKLDEYEQSTSTQDQVVLAFYQHAEEPISPSQCHEALICSGALPGATPLTSIRRSITNLTKLSFLAKTERKVRGVFGRPEYCWESALPPAPPVQLTLWEANA